MHRYVIRLVAAAIIAAVCTVIIRNPYSSLYMEQIKSESTSASERYSDLNQEIAEKAEKLYIPPQDAQIHRVWKAIPGYNGISVDVEASFNKMKKKGVFNEKLLVYRQIPPGIHLADLPAEPVYMGHPDKPMAAFLINVAWGNEYIPTMLETLKKHHVKATFFLEGRWVKENPDLAKMITDAGQEVGNHSYTHPDMAQISSASIREQLQKTNDVIKTTTGVTPSLFAPPSGSYRMETVGIADELGLKTIMWSVDTIDWQKPEPAVLMDRVLKKVHNGAMILMHPTESSTASMEELIVTIKNRGISLGSVSMLLDEERHLPSAKIKEN
ncbi:polysaccharide deacetylase family protein [Bacillus lacus]|uniref:Polysaccharide deacetylase family protein n=1 Tax=Metabacillus lacus TaxID=1983721 RepID=A0A7X2LWW2_9BACI|nr:polysaccharide deacetylase family protein [Metabacillus lacus]MRX70641.1 polysaccharide deacetylase family protein [Metabacillus lacus]